MDRWIMVCLSLFITLLAHANTVEKLDHFIYLGLEEWVELETTIATNTKHTTTKIATAVIFITANNIKVTDTSNPVGILEAVPSTYIRSNHFAFRPLIHLRDNNSNQALLITNSTPIFI